MPFRAENRDRRRLKSRPALSQDCGKRHEKTSTTDTVDWIVRGDGATGGWAGSGARTCTSAGANTNAPSGADACATTAHEDRSAEHSKCGRQRGDVYNDLRAAGSGFRIERQLRQLDGVPGADAGALAAATRSRGGSGARVLPAA